MSYLTSMKIIVSGGLGNQMFQYALYLALKDKGRDIMLDNSLYSHVEMHYGYELKRCFGLNDPPTQGGKLHLLFLRILLKLKPKKILYQDTLEYNENVFTTRCNYISGYWQSEKYFCQIENIIRATFEFKSIDAYNKNLAEEINSQNSVSIHLRRGDYLGNSLYSGICADEYYMKAIDEIVINVKKNDDLFFYVFSDDKEYASEFINKLNYPARLIDFNKGEDSYKDMYLMSQCKHNIIANSSFSWWGAWLNTYSDKIVVAPQKWFNIENENHYRDIVPDNWIKI